MGIGITEFRERLIEPLRDVVFIEEDRHSKDYYYRARHQHVAEVVFNQVLTSQNDKFDLLVTLIRSMNPDYTSDAETFASIIKGRSVASMFSSVELGRLLTMLQYKCRQASRTFCISALFLKCATPAEVYSGLSNSLLRQQRSRPETAWRSITLRPT
jgi:hypothetical protein